MRNLRRVEENHNGMALLLRFQKFHTMWNTNQYFSLSQHTQNTHKTLLVFKIQADKSTNLILSTFLLNSKITCSICQEKFLIP